MLRDSLTPTPEEARRAQEASRRAVEQEIANGYPRIMPEREATIRAQEALAASMYGQAQGVAEIRSHPGKMFSREAILAIIAAERTKWVPEPTEIGGARFRAAMQALDDLQRIFENLE